MTVAEAGGSEATTGLEDALRRFLTSKGKGLSLDVTASSNQAMAGDFVAEDSKGEGGARGRLSTEHTIKAEVLFSKSSIATQILLSCEGNSLLVDVGDGTVRDLTSRGFDFTTLVGVLITHEHADHSGGLFSLLHFMKHMPKEDPLLILTPKPATYLREFVKPPLMYSRLPFRVEVMEVGEGSIVECGSFKVRPFRAAHVDLSSIGYSISSRSGYRVVVSGDTAANERLRRSVSGADLAILEATFEDGQEEYAKEFGHMTLSQARRVGRLAKEALYVHQMPQDYFRMMTCAVIGRRHEPQAAPSPSLRGRRPQRRR